jgi:hypothetical protein
MSDGDARRLKFWPLWSALAITALAAFQVGGLLYGLNTPELWGGAHQSLRTQLVAASLVLCGGISLFWLSLRTLKQRFDTAA